MTAALQSPDKQDWTVDDLASLPPDLNYELIDGRLILPSPTGLHQMLGIKILTALEQACPDGYSVVPDMSMEIDRRNEPRPDVVVLHDSVMLQTPAPVDQAILAVEVISPSSHWRDLHAKARVYARSGIGTYLVVDPVSFDHGVVLTEFRISDEGDYEIITSTSEIFETDAPFPIKINLAVLTALRDKYLAARDDA
ncbi:Uma2 family endonuclease [Actinoplanes xinjiangensis]|uniref:Uma2 family endonuclease n=1 Tax=Actinoplanes xinjiangensis TaxID=512350 RepID=UPI003427802B